MGFSHTTVPPGRRLKMAVKQAMRRPVPFGWLDGTDLGSVTLRPISVAKYSH